MNNKLLWVAVAVIVVVVGGALLLSNKSGNNNNTQTNNNQNAQPTQAMQITGSEVTVTSSGFEPKSVTVKAGTRVVWTNKSGGAVTVNSAVHPTHLLWPFLNLGKFDDGSSVSVVFEKTGTYKYHNHLDASQTGTVVVQ